MNREIADHLILPGGVFDRDQLTDLILEVAEHNDGCCMDEEAERERFADALIKELMWEAEEVTIPRGKQSRENLKCFLCVILGFLDGFCMDNDAEREALADIMAVELLCAKGIGPEIADRMFTEAAEFFSEELANSDN